MPKITLNRQESEAVLANPDSDSGSRLIAAAAILFFEANESAEDASKESIFIAQKLMHMTQAEIYEATGTVAEAVGS